VPTPDRTISGTITDLSGRPLEGIHVLTFGGPGDCSYETKTDRAGRYQIGVRAGLYTLDVWDDAGTYPSGFYSTSGFTYSMDSASSIDAQASDAGSVDMALPLAIHAVITVTDANGSPIKGLNCYIMLGGQYPATTNGQGTCTFVVWPGKFSLWFQDPLGRYPEGYLTPAGYSVDPYAAVQVFQVTADSPDFHIAVSMPDFK
jgi:Carboxypeptidase regulatory-like domain